MGSGGTTALVPPGKFFVLSTQFFIASAALPALVKSVTYLCMLLPFRRLSPCCCANYCVLNSESKLKIFSNPPKHLRRCKVKPHGSLVPVSSTHRCAYTPGLSTSSSLTFPEFGMGSGGTTALVPPGKFFVLSTQFFIASAALPALVKSVTYFSMLLPFRRLSPCCCANYCVLNSESKLKILSNPPKHLRRCKVKPHGSLVPVSSTHRCAYTPGLSTSSSSTFLQETQFPTLTWGDPTLPSALRRFTSEFGMGSGGTTALVPPGKFFVLVLCLLRSYCVGCSRECQSHTYVCSFHRVVCRLVSAQNPSDSESELKILKSAKTSSAL